MSERWIETECWDKCFDPAMNMENFIGQDCIEAADCAFRIRTFSTARIYRRALPTGKNGADENHFFAFLRHSLDADRIDTVLAADLNVPGVRELVIDPYDSLGLLMRLKRGKDWPAAVELVESKRTYEKTSAPMKELRVAIHSGRFHHNGDSDFRHMVSNVHLKISAGDNWYPAAASPADPIGGAIALIMAAGRLIGRE